jgi:putative DNA primase/helicase
MAIKRPPLPFKEIAEQALRSAETLVHRWIPGGKSKGHEYQATNPNRHDNKPGSFSINTNTGSWGDFATDDKGGDLVSLYAYLHGLEQYEAAIEVADQLAFKLPESVENWRAQQGDVKRKAPIVDPDAVKQKKPAKESPWVVVSPIPYDAPEPHKAHEFRGVPSRTWCYRDADGKVLGYIYRFETSDGGKETIPHVLCRNTKNGKLEWRWLQWPEPRPIYGLDRLAAQPDAWVLLVEGEKCADAPMDMIKGVPVSWPGGSNGVDKVDWSPLAGKKIYAWADCDSQREKLTKAEKEAGMDPLSKPYLPEHKQPGIKAMLQIREKLLALDPTTEFHLVDIPPIASKPDGWDVADAIAEGMDTQALLSFIMNTRADIPAPDRADDSAAPKQPDTPNSATAGEGERVPSWKDYLLVKKGDLVACLANVYDILANDEKWKGVIAFDEFAQKVVKLKKPPYYEKNGEIGEWDAQDDAKTAMWLTRTYRLNIPPTLAADAVEAISREHTINPPQDWLKSLEWDGNHRVDTWMLDYMGVPINDYTKRVARWFMMGMVKRIFEPGCQLDYCLVLESKQGRKKSSVFQVLGGQWFGDTDLDLHNKDSMSALRGKMLYEFSEMGSVAKAEATRQKSFLTRRVDEYRPVYGRREIRVPRSVVFCGTTNDWEWNKDPTGGRRFWPVEVKGEIDEAGIAAVRDQLFAEAVVMVRKKLRHWPTIEEQEKLFDPVQLSRSVQESYVDALHDKVMEQVGEFSLFYAATEWLKIDASKLSRDVQTRIGNALRQLGCTKHEKRTHVNRSWYKPPTRNEATSTEQQVSEPVEEPNDDIPF